MFFIFIFSRKIIGIRVTADFGDNIIFTAETYIQFMYSGVNIVTNPTSLSSIVGVDERLVIDFSDSSTDDIVYGEVCLHKYYFLFFYKKNQSISFCCCERS